MHIIVVGAIVLILGFADYVGCLMYLQFFLKLFGRWGEGKALVIAAFFPTIAIATYAIIYHFMD